jgi:hypothetical protein
VATVNNPKRKPISIGEMRKQLPLGIKILECCGGIALVSSKDSFDNIVRWWVDIRSISLETIPSKTLRTDHNDARERLNTAWKLTNIVNQEVYGIKPR